MPRGQARSKTGIVDGLIGEVKKLRQLFQGKENMPELKEVFDKEILKSLTKVKAGLKNLTPKSKTTRKATKKTRKKGAKKATPSAEGKTTAKTP
jgi:hypothetical protein